MPPQIPARTYGHGHGSRYAIVQGYEDNLAVDQGYSNNGTVGGGNHSSSTADTDTLDDNAYYSGKTNDGFDRWNSHEYVARLSSGSSSDALWCLHPAYAQTVVSRYHKLPVKCYGLCPDSSCGSECSTPTLTAIAESALIPGEVLQVYPVSAPPLETS